MNGVAGLPLLRAVRDNPLLGWLSLLGGMTVAVCVSLFMLPPHVVGYDFQAFWCGGSALLHGANPYLNEPLHACEALHSPELFLQYPNVTVPAPLPPYALALLSPLSLLPYALARAGWWLFLIGCVIAEGWLIGRLTGKHWAFGLTVCGFALTAPIIIQGALAPLPIVLLTAGALALRNGRWRAGALPLSLAMIEPHMALPACLAAFALLPRTRAAFLVCGATALGLGLLAVGPGVFAAYFSHVLPVHALSEVDNLGQDSLTTVLHHLGVRDVLAVRIGEVQYALLAAVGIVCAWRLKRIDGDRAWLVLVPAGCAMIGGSFVHLSEVAMVIPAAALLFARRGGRWWLPLALLALPWEALVNYGFLFIPGAFVAALLLRHFGAPARYVVAGSVLVAILAVAGHIETALEIGVRHDAIADPGAAVLASISWGAWNRMSFIGPTWWLEKAMTFVPLVLFVVGVSRATARRAELPRSTGASSSASLATVMQTSSSPCVSGAIDVR